MSVVISGTGLYVPSQSISNEELVETFNQYVEMYNAEHAAAIESGEISPLELSSAPFIEKASGIKSRHVVNKSGVLDPARMAPEIPERPDDQDSVQCEMAITAVKEALENAGKKPEDVDAVIVACSNMQRPYPAMSIDCLLYTSPSPRDPE